MYNSTDMYVGMRTAIEALLLLLELCVVNALNAPFPTYRFIHFHPATKESCVNQIFRRFPVTILEPCLAYKNHVHISSSRINQSAPLILRH
jgi:hypothetical protein